MPKDTNPCVAYENNGSYLLLGEKSFDCMLPYIKVIPFVYDDARVSHISDIILFLERRYKS